jgi:uncharacterized small protein (DUF1192 family)
MMDDNWREQLRAEREVMNSYMPYDGNYPRELGRAVMEAGGGAGTEAGQLALQELAELVDRITALEQENARLREMIEQPDWRERV